MIGFAKANSLFRVLRRNPTEFCDRVSSHIAARADRWRSKPNLSTALSLEEGLHSFGLAVGVSVVPNWLNEFDEITGEVETRLQSVWSNGPYGFFHNADPTLARFCYFACRAIKPACVVSTGVAYGVTEAFVLSALERNQWGQLWSIDLPPLSANGNSFVGHAIPEAVRQRWHLTRGTSRRVLAGLLREIGRVQCFVHDSLHTYSNMLREFEAVWPYLPPGGVVIADDVEGNRAFEDFCRRASPRFACAVREGKKGSFFGVMVKR